MKRISIFILFTLLFFNLYAQIINDSEIIKSGDWIYDAIDTLSLEQKKLTFVPNTPLSAGELKLYFQGFNREVLDDSGKHLYDMIENRLYSDSNILSTEGIKLNLDLKLNPELVYKSNKNIKWSFNYFYKDFFAVMPLTAGFSDYFSIGTETFIGKNPHAAAKSENFTNMPLSFDDIEFLWPRFSYGSFGYYGDNWGINLSINREGKTIGKTQMGSIIYNKTFETDSYFELNLFANNAKYTMDIIEISNKKFMYMHEMDIIFGKRFKLGAMEGSLVNGPFETRFLVPYMINHSFGFWKEYCEKGSIEDEYYNESNACAYLGVTFEFIPFTNLKLYGMYGMNEIQLPNERVGSFNSYPDSNGFQLGINYKHSSKYDGYWSFNLEGLHNTSYMYIKQSPDWSLYKARRTVMPNGEYYNTWIGSPFGPDCFAIDALVEFNKLEKWKLGMDYQFVAHGEIDFDVFDNTYDLEDGHKIYSYYPYVKYKIAEKDNDEEGMDKAIEEGRSWALSGIKEYRNQVKIFGSYNFTRNFSCDGQFIYTFVFNNGNVRNNFQQGVEIALAGNYRFF